MSFCNNLPQVCSKSKDLKAGANTTDRHDITEIVLLNIITPNP